ncbi:META domain-containing protein [Phycicoccus duodecadis]|uniref:META domain-containing protein n=1 Tax=Phycicoccus duodecadis TaxID=173053 RepID=A0A2N3YJH0_9MICO|nr:META domain-containing protein [Phycicoccus duodecadis]PKW27012.1 META domain-containing protein [Phycicoccus duodecadis]
MPRRAVVTVSLLAALVLVLAAGAVAWVGARDRSTLGGDQQRVGSLADLAGTWTAVNDTTTPARLVAPVVLTVEGDRLAVRTGCNSAGATVAVRDSRLVLVGGGLMTTEMACLDAGVTAQEDWVVAMLTARPRLEHAGPTLALHWGPGERYWLGFERTTPATG